MAQASPLSGWFVVTGAVLILSLLAAFFVQARQYALLNQAVPGGLCNQTPDSHQAAGISG